MEIFNSQQYPVHDLTKMYGQLDTLKKQYDDDGVVVLKDFLGSEYLESLINESRALANQAYFNTVSGNPYLCESDPNLPGDHALNHKESTTLGVIAGDQLPESSVSRQIYRSQALRDFVASIIGIPKIFDYQCKLGFINIARMVKDNYLRWHFDLSDFVVSIPIQSASKGGVYQYIHNLKSDNDPNYDGVSKVLTHGSPQIKSLQTPPGSLILFQGKHTMHRVTKVEGDVDRYVLLLGFASKDHVKGSDYLRQIRYGRTK